MLVLLVSVVIAVIAYFLLTQIDLIVHGQLYGFGLIFSPEWANSYWAILRSVYACLVTLVVLNSIAFLSGLLRKKQKLALRVRRDFLRGLWRARDFEERVRETSEVEMLSGKDPSDLVENLEVEVEQEREPQVAAMSLESEDQGNDSIACCPQCKRTCRRPLVMLDFDGAKSRLVNVCPYCNQILGSHEEEVGVYSDANVVDEKVKQ